MQNSSNQQERMSLQMQRNGSQRESLARRVWLNAIITFAMLAVVGFVFLMVHVALSMDSVLNSIDNVYLRGALLIMFVVVMETYSYVAIRVFVWARSKDYHLAMVRVASMLLASFLGMSVFVAFMSAGYSSFFPSDRIYGSDYANIFTFGAVAIISFVCGFMSLCRWLKDVYEM